MKCLAFLLAFASLSPAVGSTPAQVSEVSPQPTPDPVALDLAHQIINIASPPEQRLADLADRFEMLKGQMFKLADSRFDLKDPEMQTLFKQHMDRIWSMMSSVAMRHMPDLYEAMAVSYARHFSVDELRDILAFAQTPSGKKFLRSGKDILKDPGVIAVQEAMMNDMFEQMPTLQAALMSDLEAKKAKNH